MALERQQILDMFHQALGRLVHAHAQFDFNIGMQLNVLGLDTGHDVSELLVGKAPFSNRLRKAEDLVFIQYASAPDAAKQQLEQWFIKAHEVKAMRNDYTHARWQIPNLSDSDDPLFRMLPLNWNFDPNQEDKSVPIRLSDLHADAAEIERLDGGLGGWMRKYLVYAAPRVA
jgi:hypothetical protein